jgi:hypothetical protein
MDVDVIASLLKERQVLLRQNSELQSQIKVLTSRLSQSGQKLTHLEQLLIAYDCEIEQTAKKDLAGDLLPSLLKVTGEHVSVSASVSQKRDLARPPLVHPYEDDSPIVAIGKRLAVEPERIFTPDDLIEDLFGNALNQLQYAVARRHIIAELSRGAQAGRWYKIPKRRGLYKFNKEEESIQAETPESLQTESDLEG